MAAALYRLSIRRVHPKFDLRPDRCAVAGALGQSARHDPGFYFTQHRDPSHLPRRRRLVATTDYADYSDRNADDSGSFIRDIRVIRGYSGAVNLWIGTSGFQYSEWKGNFYPEALPTAKMLPFYPKPFSTTDIN